MKILYYNDLEIAPVKKQLDKVVAQLQQGDFKSAEVKKMPNTGYFRAKLDRENRLLFKIGVYQGERYLFLLEVILHHAYEKSRFLNGAAIDDDKLVPLPSPEQLTAEELTPVAYIRPTSKQFHILDKIISFDEEQDAIFQAAPPLIIIGSAGSGKTALTLEKIKPLRGKVLYVTLSSFLVENSRNLYYAFQYDNEQQEVDFLSFQEYLGSIDLPKGKAITFRDFERWIWRYQQAFKIKDAHKVFEEFKGVITGAVTDAAYLAREAYVQLGVRQSVFTADERGQLYDLFLKYLDFLAEGTFYDANIAAFERLNKVQPYYDFVVVDEVQDITNVQLLLLLKSLKQSKHFMLCGDSNQIVHPNFFSWANVKRLFYEKDLAGNLTRILHTNYRNTPEVTHIANQLLLVKNARFGSIDKESTYLVKANAAHQGAVEFYEDKPQIKQELDKRTGKSAKFAVLVMRNEDKVEARKFFNTPLLFSVQEAKGLEYDNIILYNIISNNEAEFRELCRGVSKGDLESELVFSRAKDKTDKSLEIYKFYVNSLYVAITRAVKNLYVVERVRKHDLLELLELTNFRQQVELKTQESSLDDWQKEARKLELQGKQEQAEEIRKQILKVQAVPWEVITVDRLQELKQKAFDPNNYNKKAKDTLYEYALMYYETWVFDKLVTFKYNKAADWKREGMGRMERKFPEFFNDNLKQVETTVRKYGLDYRTEFNLTPLMMATLGGSVKIIHFLLELGAQPDLKDNLGRQAFQIALLKSYQSPQHYGAKVLDKIYHTLQPDSLRVKFKNKLIKLDNHQMEFFMVNYMIALTREMTTYKIQMDLPGFQTADFLQAVEHYPHAIMPEYRKKRTYLSAMLSKNEVYRQDPYNRQLFYRIRQGYYILNPLLELEIEDGWKNIYEVLQVTSDQESAPPRLKRFINYLEEVKIALETETRNQP